MPNHVQNEIIFHGVNAEEQDKIIALCCNRDGKVDFDILVPTPKNVWLFSHGTQHEKLGDNALDWSRKNWGTKWNAYGQDKHAPVERDENTITLRFQTAWSPPYGWLMALFNTAKRDFDHNWLDEGADRGWSGQWRWPGDSPSVTCQPWVERRCDDAMQKHLNVLLWGVENLEELS